MNKLNPLTPDLLSDISPYDVFLDNAIKDPRIKNVAITGRYGSGKSTIIDSFIDLRHKDSPRFESDGRAITDFKIIEKLSKAFNKLNKYINSPRLNFFSTKSNSYNSKASSDNIIKISLAKFTDDKNDNIDSKILESEILRQILNQVQSYKIPLSNLKRTLSPDLIEKNPNRSILKILFYGIILFWCSINNLIQIIKSNISSISEFGFINFVSTKVDWYNFITILNIISVSFLVILSYSFLKKIFYMLSSLNLSKIGFKAKGLEVEFASISDSLLNKYVAELVYVFNQNSTTAVIFEDLDRFQKLDIFSKLRYLCFQLNNNCELKHPLTFVYAIDDSLFTNNEERTKFFDLIIPVVSYMNRNNVAHILESLFENVLFPNNFLLSISVYFFDIRIVKNIANEFVCFKKNICFDDNGIDEKFLNVSIFVLVWLKNYMPREFYQLYSNEGLIYYLFNNWKKELIREVANYEDEEEYLICTKLKEIIKQYNRKDPNLVIGCFQSFNRAIDRYFASIGNQKYSLHTRQLLFRFIKNGLLADNYYDFIISSSDGGMDELIFFQNIYMDGTKYYNSDLNINPKKICFRLKKISNIDKPVVLNHYLVDFLIKEVYKEENQYYKPTYTKMINIFKNHSKFKEKYIEERISIKIKPEIEDIQHLFLNDVFEKMKQNKDDKFGEFLKKMSKKLLNMS